MKIKRLFGLLMCVLIVGLTALTCAAPTPAPTPTPTPAPTPTPPKEINLRFTMYFPADSLQTKVGREFYQEIEKRSNGQVKFTYYPGGSLMEGPPTTDGVKSGIADIGFMSIGHVAGRFPVSEVIMTHIGFSSAFITGHVADDFYNQFKPKEWNDFKILVPGGNSAFVTFSTKPVNKLEDFKGMKVRAPGSTGKQMQALGAAPVNMPMGDAFDGLTKGVIDGNVSSMEAAKTWRLAEACQYLIQTWAVIAPAGYFLIMNKDSYNNLPPNIQTIFNQVSADYVDKFALAWNEADMVSWEYCKQLKIKVIDPSQEEVNRWAQAMAPFKEQYIQDMVKRGFSQSEIESWFAFLKTRIDYWLKQQVQRGIKSPVGPPEIRAS
jgi:TRAP-type C4-dicarboxylate transport system substrate-binding protein